MSTRNTSGYNGYPVPIGTIFPFGGNSNRIPAGYLLCSGTEHLITDFPDLYAVIGSAYSAGATPGYFKVPDLVNHQYIVGRAVTDPTILQAVIADIGDVPITTNNLPHLTSANFNVTACDLTATTAELYVRRTQNPPENFYGGAAQYVVKDNSSTDQTFSVTVGGTVNYVNNNQSDATALLTATSIIMPGWRFCFIIKAYDFPPTPVAPAVVPQVPNPTRVYFDCPELSGFIIGS